MAQKPHGLKPNWQIVMVESPNRLKFRLRLPKSGRRGRSRPCCRSGTSRKSFRVDRRFEASLSEKKSAGSGKTTDDDDDDDDVTDESSRRFLEKKSGVF